ncbi:hypothetical protein V8G54_021351 [Vigna mungo]|uniref:Kinesin motor domain-containing protein n=1 Tax=Vigna mungo TaxID=3915 RepID=A0AAQ3NFE1_VIGMU
MQITANNLPYKERLEPDTPWFIRILFLCKLWKNLDPDTARVYPNTCPRSQKKLHPDTLCLDPNICARHLHLQPSSSSFAVVNEIASIIKKHAKVTLIDPVSQSNGSVVADKKELRHTLRTTKSGMQFMQMKFCQEFSNLAHAASGYHRVLEENRKLYNQVQDLKGNKDQCFLVAFGGQAKTLMYVHISPERGAIGETITTLKFAERVATIELGAARVNKDSSDVKELKEQDFPSVFCSDEFWARWVAVNIFKKVPLYGNDCIEAYNSFILHELHRIELYGDEYFLSSGRELRHTLRTTKSGMQFMQMKFRQEFSNLGKDKQDILFSLFVFLSWNALSSLSSRRFWVHGLAHAASGYHSVLEENRELYNQV